MTLNLKEAFSSPSLNLTKEIARLLEEVTDSPEAEARTLRRHFKLEEFPNSDSPINMDAVFQLEKAIEKRLESAPLQYILGYCGFRNMFLDVDERVLIPRPETEITCEEALKCLVKTAEEIRAKNETGQDGTQPHRLRALDLGCGSGAIGLSLVLEFANVEVVLSDVSRDALDLAHENYQKIKSPPHLFPHVANSKPERAIFRRGDWFEALSFNDELFHLIVSNPPYISDSEILPDEIQNYEPQVALRSGPTGLESIQKIITGAKDWLHPGGYLVLEIAESQREATEKIARSSGFTLCNIFPDLAGRERVFACQKPEH